MKILPYLFLIFIIAIPSYTKTESIGQSTGFKLPRFVSTKSNESNLRIGASLDYPIRLIYSVKNFPLGSFQIQLQGHHIMP